MWPLPKRAVGAAVVAAVAFARGDSAEVAEFEWVVSDPHPLPDPDLAILAGDRGGHLVQDRPRVLSRVPVQFPAQ
jgi:hypothetical protein